MIKVLFFASLRERVGWAECQLCLPLAACTAADIWSSLLGTEVQPEGVRVAINKQFCSFQTPLRQGDELAFLPPVTGG